MPKSLGIPDNIRRDLDELKEIHTNMRLLEFSHSVEPGKNDVNDYKMLVDDLAAIIRNLTAALDDSARGGDFPTTINDALTTTPDNTPTATHPAPTERQRSRAAS